MALRRGSVRSRSRGGSESLADDEQSIVLRALVDPSAFEPLSRRYLTPVYRICWKWTGEEQAACDCTHESFARTLARLATFSG